MEKRLLQKEENLEKRVDLLEQKEAGLTKRERSIQQQERTVGEKEKRYTLMIEEQRQKLISAVADAEAARAKAADALAEADNKFREVQQQLKAAQAAVVTEVGRHVAPRAIPSLWQPPADPGDREPGAAGEAPYLTDPRD